MSARANENLRELRRILGQTQEEFAATIGASKDTVVSWEVGRNAVSKGMARRISLATGVDEESLLKGRGPLLTRFARVVFTAEEFQRHQQRFWGGRPEEWVGRQLERCEAALELLLGAAARAGRGAGPARLAAVVDAFNQWCEETRKDFGLEAEIDAQLAERQEKLELTHSYAQWREMAKSDPEMARKMGFKDDPKREGSERLRLSLETVPEWKPGERMRSRRRSGNS